MFYLGLKGEQTSVTLFAHVLSELFKEDIVDKYRNNASLLPKSSC